MSCRHSGVLSRRNMLATIGHGFGSLALASLLDSQAQGSDNVKGNNPLAPKVGHFPAKAKAVIWLFMNGGQSQVDTWDYKPELAKRDGQTLAGFDNATGFFPEQVGGLMKSPFAFSRAGKSGTWVSELMPNV